MFNLQIYIVEVLHITIIDTCIILLYKYLLYFKFKTNFKFDHLAIFIKYANKLNSN